MRQGNAQGQTIRTWSIRLWHYFIVTLAIYFILLHLFMILHVPHRLISFIHKDIKSLAGGSLCLFTVRWEGCSRFPTLQLPFPTEASGPQSNSTYFIWNYRWLTFFSSVRHEYKIARGLSKITTTLALLGCKFI